MKHQLMTPEQIDSYREGVNRGIAIGRASQQFDEPSRQQFDEPSRHRFWFIMLFLIGFWLGLGLGIVVWA